MGKLVVGLVVGFVLGALAVVMADDPVEELDWLEDPCGHWSGWHDDGDPICCERPEGHELARLHRSQGIEWTDREADARIEAARAELSR